MRQRLCVTGHVAFCAFFSVSLFACDDSGGGSADAGLDASTFECPHGLNPHGNGCFIPCEDGWHEGADGFCHKDCLPGFEEDPNGFCDLAVCSDEESVIFWQEEDEFSGVVSEGSLCVPTCPAEMLTANSGNSLYCRLPCPDGWNWDETSRRCNLSCPEGMIGVTIEGLDKCELIEVGENKACPQETYDLSFIGDNPLYVDSSSVTSSPNGTIERPFRTIMEAVDVSGDVVTIYVGPGLYDEQIVLAEKTEVNLIGSCAGEVVVSGQNNLLSGGVPSATVDATDVDRLFIDGLTIMSNLSGVRVSHFSNGEAVVVTNSSIGPTGLDGISVSGLYNTVDITDNTIAQTSLRGVLVDMDPEASSSVPLGGAVTISGNIVSDIAECIAPVLAPDACPSEEDMFASGISVWCAQDVSISNNQVSNIAYNDIGVGAAFVTNTSIERNLATSLQGSATAVAVRLSDAAGDEVQSVHVKSNVVEDCRAGFTGGVDAENESIVMGISLKWTDGDVEAILDSNIVRRIQGIGIFAYTSSWLGGLTVDSNLLEDVPFALVIDGRLTLKNNRLLGCGDTVVSFDSSTYLNIYNNHFAHSRSSDSFDLPPSNWNTALNTDGSAITLRSTPSAEVVFSGNQVEECYRENGALSISGVDDASVTRNFFYKNRGDQYPGGTFIDAYISNIQYPKMESNVFIGGVDDEDLASTYMEAMRFEGETDDHFTIASIDGNFIYGYGELFSIVGALKKPRIGVFDISYNTFWNAGWIMFDDGPMSHGASTIRIRHNVGYALGVFIRNTDLLEMRGNFFVPWSLFVGNSENTDMTVIDNVLELNGLQLYKNSFHTGEITNNEIYRPWGAGVMAIDTRNLSISGNTISDTLTGSIEETGEVSDSLHIVGSSHISEVEIKENRISSSERLGVLISQSSAYIEGNMYIEAGDDCGGTCDIAVQYEPEENSVHGWDVRYAVYPEAPYGVVTGEWWD